MNTDALKDLLYRMADDKLIMGHRSSEWVGLGPILEEDIAFASMAQDEIGHAQSYYMLLQELGESDPDTIAFTRDESSFRCCHFVEMPIGEYDFSLMRHYLFEMADMVRLNHLMKSSYQPLQELAAKIAREEKYHQLHGKTFVQQLSNGGDVAKARMQTALNETYPLAFGVFEPTVHSATLAAEGVMPLEDELMKEWRMVVEPFLQNTCGLTIPSVENFIDHFGGRSGNHTVHLAPMLAEMTEVYAIDPAAKW